MKFFLSTLFTLITLFSASSLTQAQTPFARAMQDGQHVLLMRHADAPGYGDPQGYQLNQCSSQRNLGERGKKQAQAIGDWIAKQGIQQAKVYSSAWCRCLTRQLYLIRAPLPKRLRLGLSLTT